MSATQGISSGSSGLSAQFLQRIRERAGGSSSAAQQDPLRQFAADNGITGEKFDKLRSDIDSAVESTLNGTGGAGASREAIKSAVQGVLKDNGLDPAEFEEQLKKLGPPAGFGGPGGPGGPGGQRGPGGAGGLGGSAGIDKETLDQLLKLIDSGEEDPNKLFDLYGTGALVDSEA